jgi:L-alanine-DL-glutamate epimerase-like enolase superfamily enzyme
MPRPTDIRVRAATVWFLPVRTRLPLKFGPETLTSVTCARARVRVEDRRGRSAVGWGETPLSVQWVWPSRLPYEPRHAALKEFCLRVARAWTEFDAAGHPIELGWDFQRGPLRQLLAECNAARGGTKAPTARSAPETRGSTAPRPTEANPPSPAPAPAEPEPMPWLAALVCCSVLDQAVHDAYGRLLDRPVYTTYGEQFLSRDLADFLEPARGMPLSFRGLYPADYLARQPPTRLRAWHLVGGLDPLSPAELTGAEPNDGYPVLLADWIRTDGLKCLKVKLRGTDAAWDYARLVAVGRIAVEHDVEWLSADFNCTVTDPAYVNDILDRLRAEHPRLFAMLLYVEQPFPYDLEAHRLDVRSVAARKPLFLDESAHDWPHIRLGRELGWTGVALKTCKTQTGALLSACWARAHGMVLMVQDLTNPMLAQIPHVLLAAHVGTIMGVETNAMQFYPAASAPEAAVHPGLYRRRHGEVDLSTVRGPGFGYRVEEIRRELPAPAGEFGD